MGIVDFGEVLDEDVLMCVEVGAVVMVDCKVGITGNEGITIIMLSVSPICTQPFFTLCWSLIFVIFQGYLYKLYFQYT